MQLNTPSASAKIRLLQAAEHCLLRDGYAALSTRGVADNAETPLSQIHHHFGSKQNLMLELLKHQNAKLLERQARTFEQDAPLSQRWLRACDYLDEDLRSGYVRVLQEIIAAGYSDERLAEAARELLAGWFELLHRLAPEAREVLGGWGEMSGEEIACLIGLAFLGAESMLLIGMDLPIRGALRGVGRTIERLEAERPEAHGREVNDAA